MRRALRLFLLVAVAGCGAKVVFVDDDGDGAGAGAEGGGAAAPATGTGTTSMASTTSGFLSACQRLCMDHAACFGGESCQAQCDALYTPDCVFETDELVFCLALAFGPNCELGSDCDGELAVYEECVMPSIDCVEGVCTEGQLGCSCVGDCEGTTLKQICEIEDDFINCKCSVDRVEIGTCIQTDLGCDLDTGCCKPLWLGMD